MKKYLSASRTTTTDIRKFKYIVPTTLKDFNADSSVSNRDASGTQLGFRRVLRVFRRVLREPLITRSRVHEEHDGRHEGHEAKFTELHRFTTLIP